jgi:hypothetical protein
VILVFQFHDGFRRRAFFDPLSDGTAFSRMFACGVENQKAQLLDNWDPSPRSGVPVKQAQVPAPTLPVIHLLAPISQRISELEMPASNYYAFSSHNGRPRFPLYAPQLVVWPTTISRGLVGPDVIATLFNIMRLFHPLHTHRVRFRAMVNGVYIYHIGKPADGPSMVFKSGSTSRRSKKTRPLS